MDYTEKQKLIRPTKTHENPENDVSDFWIRVSQQMSYIDSSTKSSLNKCSETSSPRSRRLPVDRRSQLHSACLSLDELRTPKRNLESRESHIDIPDGPCKSLDELDRMSTFDNPTSERPRFVKQLSFVDPVDTSTNIYTPDEECGLSDTQFDSKRILQSEMEPSDRRCSTVDPYTNHLIMILDLRYYFQHPYPRIIVLYSVIICNFLLFSEDPISHSYSGK